MHSRQLLRNRNFWLHPYRTLSVRQCGGHDIHASPSLSEGAKELPELPYKPGASLSYSLIPTDSCSPVPVTAEVIQSHLPFTNGQAIQARITSSATTSSLLPKTILLKLFDRRFAERSVITQPWSSAGEAQLRKKVLDHLAKGGQITNMLPRYDGIFNDHKYCATSTWIQSTFWDTSKRHTGEIDPDDWESWEHEVWAYARMLECTQHEAAVYAQLSPLQGTKIPRLYGIVSCESSPSNGPRIPGDDIISHVPGLAMEYIDGLTVRDLKVGKNISESEAESASQGILSTLRDMRRYRIAHADVRGANILVRHCDRSPVIIDFGSAIQGKDASEKDWFDIATGLHDLRDARDLLWRCGLHLPSPLIFEPDARFNGYSHRNKKIEQWYCEEWRRKYVDPVEISGPLFEIRQDANGKEYKWEISRWRFKPGVNTHGPDDE